MSQRGDYSITGAAALPARQFLPFILSKAQTVTSSKSFLLVLFASLTTIQAQAQASLAVAQADSTRRYLCLAAYLFENSRHQASKYVENGTPVARVTSVTASTMTAIADAVLPRANTALAKLRLVDVPDSMRTQKAEVEAVLNQAYSVFNKAAVSIDYRANPTMRAIGDTEAAMLEVATLMDREYRRSRSKWSSDTVLDCLAPNS